MPDATSIPTTPPAAPPHRGPEKPHWRFGFWSLIVTQFQNAFNDNAIKYLVIYIIVAMNFQKAERDKFVWIVSSLFAIPFILFSLTGGYFADRYSKRSVVIGTKFMELLVMAVTILGLWLQNLPLECAGVFLISTQSALFGPSKYGLLPEVLPDNKLSWGNGIIELGTFVGSISAVMAAGYLFDHFQGRQQLSGAVLLGCTLLGLATSFGINHVPAADPHKKFRWDPFAELADQMRIVFSNRILNWAVWGNVFLWGLAALLQLTIVVYGHDTLRVDEAHISYLQAAVGIGIGVGSVAAGYLSRGKIEYRLIPLGALGMTIFGILLYPSGHTVHSATVHLALLGFFGGFYAVPINALIQHLPAPAHKGGVIAAANLLSFIGVFLAAGAYYLFSTVFHQTPAGVFLDGALLTGAMTLLCFYCYFQIR